MPLPARRQLGFSLAELVVALLVAVILIAVSLPLFLRAIHSYQLSNAAQQVAGILRLARYQAIRLNKPVICVFGPFSGDPTMTSASMTDSTGTPLTGIGATTVVLGPTGNLVVSSAVPGAFPTGPTGALPTGVVPLSFPPAGGIVKFDARGAVLLPASVANAFYLASAAAPDAGYRAVLLLPAGSIQIWSIDPQGLWQEQR